MTDPFAIAGPALVSVSGGRSSAYLLRRVLDANNGALPDGVVAAFANTGKEREETLRFVHECGERWGVPIRWIEYAGAKTYRLVDFNSASRSGEPFARLIDERKFVPNPLRRFCTQELKINPINAYLRDALGWTSWSNVVGLRADEGYRLIKVYGRNLESDIKTVCPFDKAQVTKRDVLAFWGSHDFDLQLRPDESNCDLCFMKRPAILRALMHERPQDAAWWVEQEKKVGGQFNVRHSYAEMSRSVAAQMHLFDSTPSEDEHDVECGLICAGNTE